MSSPGVLEPLKEPVVDLLPAGLALGCGVIALGLQGGAELDRGDEEGAGLADRFVVAFEFGGSGAEAVAELDRIGFRRQADGLPGSWDLRRMSGFDTSPIHR